MKKSIIAAGAASAVLAAMPVVGVFADNTITGDDTFIDAFEFTIEDSCGIERGSTAHASASNGTPAVVDNWVTGNDDDNDTTNGGNGILTGTDKLTLTNVTAGNTYSMGSSTFVVKCNYTGGYDVNVTATTLTNGTDPISVGSTAVGTESSSWTISRTVEGSPVYYGYDASHNKIFTGGANDITTGVPFTVNYNLGLVSNQASGTYTGSATYVLTSPAA